MLEIGCGVGFDAYRLIEAGAEYTGIDLTPENAERTRRHLMLFGHSVNVMTADAENLPFPDGTFDVGFSNGVLHHTPNMDRALAEAGRVLRPGGHLWLILYHRNSAFYWLTLYLEHYLLRQDFRRYPRFADRVAAIEYTTSGAAPIVHALGRGDLRALLERAGFTDSRMWVRKLNREDLPTLPGLRRLWRHVPQSWLDSAGRHIGWYLIAQARKPG